MKSSRALFVLLAVVLVPGGLLLLLPLFAKPVGNAVSRLTGFRLSPIDDKQ